MEIREKQIINLTNFWEKAKYYIDSLFNSSKLYTDTAISNINSFQLTIVQSLPEVGSTKTLYLVPTDDPDTLNTYDEFVYTENGTYEQIGSRPYKPDHKVEDDNDLEKLIVTIGDDLYVIPRIKVVPVTAPTYSLSDSSYDGSKTLQITAEEGATIRYNITTSTNGNNPTAPTDPTKNSGTEYSSNISLSQDNGAEVKKYSIKAIATLNGAVSSVVSKIYSIYRKLATPTIGTPTGNDNSSTRLITISGPSGSTLYYTITFGENEITGNVSANESEQNRTITLENKGSWDITLYASQDNWKQSNNATLNDVVVKKIAIPSISADVTDYDNSRSITLSCNTSGVTIYYNFSGFNAEEWETYSNSFDIDGTKTIYVKVEKTDWTTTTNSKTITLNKAHTHYGVSTKNAADSTILSDLASEVKAESPTGTYTFTNNTSTAKYMWIFVPNDQAAITEMNNANNMNQIGQWNKSSDEAVQANRTITINGIVYKWYRSKNTITNDSTTLYINKKNQG